MRASRPPYETDTNRRDTGLEFFGKSAATSPGAPISSGIPREPSPPAESKTGPRVHPGAGFASCMKNKGLIVDKTLLVSAITDDPTQVILITCPRAFGKTFNLQMLRSFFAKQEDHKNDMSSSFHALKIWKDEYERYRLEQGKYPVVFISFASCHDSCFDNMVEDIKLKLSDLYREHKKFLYSSILKDDVEQQHFYQKIIQRRGSEIETKSALAYLVRYLHMAHGQQVMVLIDEYDRPIHDGYTNNYYPQIAEFMRNLLFPMLDGCKDVLYKAVLIGRVSEENVFSGITNLRMYSMLSDRYNPYFGFSDEEVLQLLPEITPPIFDKIQKAYGGYYIGQKHVFDPSAVVNFIDDNRRNSVEELEFKNYRVHTLDMELLEQFLNKKPSLVRLLSSLLENKTCTQKIATHIHYAKLDTDDEVLLSFLVQFGYISCAERTDFDTENKSVCKLSIPNKWVGFFFEDMIKELKPKNKILASPAPPVAAAPVGPKKTH